MDVGFVGLGKLGLPTAVTFAKYGHKVRAFDVNQETLIRYRRGSSGLAEPDIDQHLRDALSSERLQLAETLDEAVQQSELVFIAVQTPHRPEYDGTHPGTTAGPDFDYTYLETAVSQVARAIRASNRGYRAVSVISTVLPGTTRTRLAPIMEEILGPMDHAWSLFYNPSFIAMGQTMRDLLNPEFVLVGVPDGTVREATGGVLARFYSTLHNAPQRFMSWEEAEAVKCFYNTFIGLKIVFANTVMQLCHDLKADTDTVLGTLKEATDRVVSPRYLAGGMGDGGACHPRDNLALSSLSRKLGLTYDLFEFVMRTREAQTEWLADMLCEQDLPIVIMGRTYKPFTDLADGSPSVLLENILRERGHDVISLDPTIEGDMTIPGASAILIGTPWPVFKTFAYPEGSVIIDPWGFLESQPKSCKLVRVGRRTV